MLSREASTEPRTLLQRVIAEIGTKGDFPAVARVIEHLRTTVAREHCAALDVARIVLQDAGFASKLLRLVNSAFYRRQGEPVSTVTRAVMMVGFEAIRDLASALLVVEELLRAGKASSYVRDGLRSALYRGLMAQRLAAQVGHPNPEEAYLLGLFADWGPLWLATHYPADFERASRLAAARGLPIEAAVREVLGGEPADLSAAIVEAWGLPATFAAHFRTPAFRDRNALTTPGARLSAVVQLVSDWTRAIESSREVAAVFGRGEALFTLSPEKLIALARETHETLREQAAALGLGRVPEPTGLAAIERTIMRPVTEPADAAPGLPGAAPPSSSTEQRALQAVADLTRSILEQRDINDILLMVLESLVGAGEFDAAFLALMTVQRDRLVGRLGCGDGVEDFVTHLSVPLVRGAGVLADVVLERRSRLVADASPGMLVPRGGAALAFQVRSFIATPILVRDKCVGVIAAARRGERAVTPADQVLVELLCNQAAVAFYHAAG